MKTGELLERIIRTREGVTESEARELAQCTTQELVEAAEKVTGACVPSKFDSCSIINAKSGKCPENCQWCAQSAHWHTDAPVYSLLEDEKIVEAALMCHERGIGRFSFVTSGRRLNDAEVDSLCRVSREIKSRCSISLCMSSGLLSEDQLRRLHEAGVARYHCNLETAPSHFGKLCTTHGQEQKIETLKAALRVGMDICSGGIFGMGESEAQRIELAFTLRNLGTQSVPVNILSPIPGTPLGDMPLMSDEDILRTIALYRLIMPTAYLRFAGGVARLSDETTVKAYKVGINAAIIGDMLTTAGRDISSNVERIRQAGYEF